MMSLVLKHVRQYIVIENLVEHGRCATKFSVTLYTEILSAETEVFVFKQMFSKVI